MRFIFIFLISLLASGCKSAGEPGGYDPNENKNKNYQQTKSSSCKYNQIDSKEYKLVNNHTLSYLLFAADKEGKPILSRLILENDLNSINTRPFKVIGAGTDKFSYVIYRHISKKSEREELINGIPHLHDSKFATKLLTNDCTLYFLSGEAISYELLNNIQHAHGGKINDDDLLTLFGKNALDVVDMEPKLKYDSFDKIINIETPFYNSMMLRGSINAKSKNLILLQLYADLHFYDKWPHISIAKDENGINHKLVKISEDADCSDVVDMGGCYLTETVGVSLSESFLIKNKNGFKLKLSGKYSQVITIPSYMIVGFLNGLDKVRNKLNNGEFESL